MRREAITLVLAMAVSTVLTAACDQQDKATVAARANPNVNPSVPKVALGAASAQERKDGNTPVQGDVDTKEPAQTQDFDQKK
jgi:Na+-translocating ferredoxin:NAD+ oxidoreductase RnfG subunit